jgi:hypothetical protein
MGRFVIGLNTSWQGDAMMRLMMKTASSALLAAGLALLAAPVAHANLPFVNGSAGFSCALSVTGAGGATAIVNQLNILNPTTINLGTCTTDFSGCTTPGDAPINIVSPVGNIIFSLHTAGPDTWNFQHIVATSIVRTSLASSGPNTLADALQVNLSGGVVDTLGTRQASLWAGIYNASGSCTDQITVGVCDAGSESATWQITVSAAQLPPPQAPEPASLSLLGVGLVGLGAIRRFARRS